jgi:hypothetical protein
MVMVKALFAMMSLTLGTEALAQECDVTEADDKVAEVAYADLDGSGKLEEIFLSSNSYGEVMVDVAFDVPEERGGASSFDPDLGLEIKDKDVWLVVEGKTVGLVEVDWAGLAKDGCGKEDYESDVQVTYRQHDGGPHIPYTSMYLGPLHCMHLCTERGEPDIYGGARPCIRRTWKCNYVGW